MKYIQLFVGVIFLVIGIALCGDPEAPSRLDPIDFAPIDTGIALQPQAIRIIPGLHWPPWDTDSSFALLSSDTSNNWESIVKSDSLQKWILTFALTNDTVYISNDTLYNGSGDFVFLGPYRNSFYFNNGSTVTLINDGDTLTHVSGAGSNVSTSGSISAAVQNAIDTFGVAPVYSQIDGTITRANTTLDTTLHQYYVNYNNPTITYFGAQTLEVTALFNYVVGKTYYLQDNARLADTADTNFDSAVLYVIANPSGNNYIINLADPRHFIQ